MTQSSITIDTTAVRAALTQRESNIAATAQAAADAADAQAAAKADQSKRTLETERSFLDIVRKLEADLGVAILSNLKRTPTKGTLDGIGNYETLEQRVVYEITNPVSAQDRSAAGGFFADRITVTSGKIELGGGGNYTKGSTNGRMAPISNTYELYTGAADRSVPRASWSEPLDNPAIATRFASELVRSTVVGPDGSAASSRLAASGQRSDAQPAA